jgi:hypothetical protein
MKGSRLVEVSLACYPQWWRERYEDEVRAVSVDLMAHGQARSRVAANLLPGALSARLKARNMPRSHELWAARTRSAIAASTIAWLVVQPVLMILFLGTTTWQGSLPPQHVSTTTPLNFGHIPSFALLAFGLYGLLFLVWLASTVVMVRGWFSLVMGIRKSTRGQRRRLMLVSMVPALSFLAATTLFFAIDSEWHGVVPGLIQPSRDTLLVSFWIVLLVGVLSSSWSVAFTTKRVDVPVRSLKVGKRTAGITSVTLFFMLALYTVVGVTSLFLPTGTTFFNTLIDGHAAWWFSSLALLVLATCISIGSSYVARRSLRVTLSLASSR